MDFKIKVYNKLLETLLKKGFSFMTMSEIAPPLPLRTIIFRHDVDNKPFNSLEFAKIQNALGIKGSFYFRITAKSWNEEVIRQISELGHEVGYHYEDLSFAWAKLRAQSSGLRAQGEEHEKLVVELGIKLFIENLEKLRNLAPVRTICMHGSPMNRWDSRLLWKYYDYHDFGIVAEPYFDADFNRMLYLTDTGRRWDGSVVAVRDRAQRAGHRSKTLTTQGSSGARGGNPFQDWKVKPIPGSLMSMTPEAIDFQNRFIYSSTSDIINSAESGKLPDNIMITFHPQRWSDKHGPWLKELVWQNIKNTAKYFIVKANNEK